MCGRYVSARDPLDLAYLLGAARVDATTPADYNVAPTKPVPVAVAGDDGPVLTVATWGLPGRAGPLFNVRSETVRDRPRLARALAQRRCLFPMDGYYEWDGPRRPHLLALPDGALLVVAGLWWPGPAGAPPSAAMLTGPATGPLARLHDRAPLVVPAAHRPAWLDPADELAGPELLHAATDLALSARPVDPAVGSVDANGPQLLTAREPDPTLF